jgi:hypothetical protein
MITVTDCIGMKEIIVSAFERHLLLYDKLEVESKIENDVIKLFINKGMPFEEKILITKGKENGNK